MFEILDIFKFNDKYHQKSDKYSVTFTWWGLWIAFSRR